VLREVDNDIKATGFAICRELQNAAAVLGTIRFATCSGSSSGQKKFQAWLRDPFHPSMQFKPLVGNVWSVRIGDHYRALGRRDADLIV
jgi:hypothetical protein